MAKRTELKIVGKGWGYQNVTENGGARRPTTNRAKAEAQLAEVQAKYPHLEFRMIDFNIVADTEIVWRQGTGRAGNSFPTKQAVERWVPIYPK